MLDPDRLFSDGGSFPGLSFAYRFHDGIAERIEPGNLRHALAEPGGWTWLHFSLTDEGARSWIAHDAAIPDRAKAILLSEDEHLLLEPIPGGVAGVFADLLRDAEGEKREIGRLRFALTDELVVSGRRSALGAIARTLEAIDAGKRFPDAMALLETIVSHFADSVAVIAGELADTLDLIEDHVIDDIPGDERQRLAPVRRTAVRLHRQLAALRGLFRRWSLPGQSELPTRIGEAAGRLAQRLDGLDHEIAAIQDRARLLQDEIGARDQPQSVRAHHHHRHVAAADSCRRNIRHERHGPAVHQGCRRLPMGDRTERRIRGRSLWLPALAARHALTDTPFHSIGERFTGNRPIRRLRQLLAQMALEMRSLVWGQF